MTTQQTPESFLMGGGAKAARFEHPGDTTAGTITEAPEVRQQTDIQSGDPVFWPSGDPKMQLIVTLQTTDADDGDDDGKRRIYVKGKSLTEAVREAVKTTGARGLEVGGTLSITYTGDGVASTKGFNPPKLYTAIYVRPDTTAQSGSFLGVTPEPAPVAAGPAQPTPEQIAGLKGLSIDPKTVYPHWNGS